MIGIIGAMEIEIQGLVSCMKDRQESVFSGMIFHKGTISGVPCVAAICGPGKVNAAVCAEAMILKYQPDAVLNIGVAGGIGKEVKIGDAVVADVVVQHDMDTTALGDEKGYISGLGQIELKADQTLVQQLLETAQGVYPAQVHTGVIATGDQFIAGGEALCVIAETFHALACEMEGGSIGHVCIMNQVPFAVFRAISDNANDDAKMDYPQFAKLAAERSCQLICAFLAQWYQQ